MATRARIVTPNDPAGTTGNAVTAQRWGRILGCLGVEVAVAQDYAGEDCELLIVLHAERNAPAIERFAARYPERALVVAISGTDLYSGSTGAVRELPTLERATRIVVLQDCARASLPQHLRRRTTVVHQSVEVPADLPSPEPGTFDACLLAHLRAVKDPGVAAEALRECPQSSRLCVVHAGAALDPGSAEHARRAEHARYRWVGPLEHGEALRLLARSRLHISTSRAEGGANAVSEAIALGVPTLATRIPGNVGLLGPDYPGYFEVGDVAALRALLLRAESESAFLAELRAHTARRAPLFAPAAEREAWRALLTELGLARA